MINIPDTFSTEYIQLAPLKNLCDKLDLRTSESKPDLIANLLEYAGSDENTANYNEVKNWILNSIYEGSKEICYKKIYINNLSSFKIDYIIKVINEMYPDCPKSDLLNYRNSTELKLVNYNIYTDENNEITRIIFSFSKLVLEGVVGEDGDDSIYPIFIEIYVPEGFIVSRGKAKSTIYNNSGEKKIKNENKISTIALATGIMQKITNIFGFEEDSVNVAKNRNGRMLYSLYSKYSFVPDEIINQLNSVDAESTDFVNDVFTKLNLNIVNLESAIGDIKIFLEKYISINGKTEHIFKEDRDAYLVKITSDDIQDSTKIDTTSAITKPLQCTDVFFDSKKAIIKNKQCKKLHLCYNRRRKYLGPYIVQFSFKSIYGILKTYYYPEECDIQYVLQTVFESY